MARHRRPVNVRDDGLSAVLGPLVTVDGVERAVLLDVDSGMVLDAWVRGEAAAPESAAPGSGGGSTLDRGPASGASEQTVPGVVFAGPDGAAGSIWSGETASGGAVFGAGSGGGAMNAADEAVFGAGPRGGAMDAGGGAVFDAGSGGGSMDAEAEAVPGSGAWPGFASWWRGLLGVDRPTGPGGAAAPGDVEAFGARHADLVRALLALPGTPPAELTLVVDDRHHLLRCVADPAGGRLALAVVVAGSPWVVRRVRRHLRQLPDAGFTTGPNLLTWAVQPPPPWPPPGRTPSDGPPADGWSPSVGDRSLPPGHAGPAAGQASPAAGQAGPAADGRSADLWSRDASDDGRSSWAAGRSLPDGGASASAADRAPSVPLPDGAVEGVPGRWPLPDEWPDGAVDGAPRSPTTDAAAVGAPPPGEAWPEAGDDAVSDPTTAVPDPRRGPAPPSALPPARSAGGR